MKKALKKILLSRTESDAIVVENTLKKRWQNILAILHNKHYDDVGIEKLLRLFLAISQFLFPGIYIKHVSGKLGIGYQELFTDLYVVLKIVFPFMMLKWGYYQNPFIFFIIIWLFIETILYLSTLVFASDLFSAPRSYRRTMLLMFLDYIQIVISYGVIYTHGNYLNKKFEHWYDGIYYSLVTTSTVGYGDYFPVNFKGKLILSSQLIIFFIVVVMFLQFFSTKIEQKGYFGKSDKN